MSRKSRRDDFLESVRQVLCDRVGGLCSNPACRISTKGPRSASTGVKSIGRAAHINAAAPEGPRYDPKQTREERRSFENGIWLCANHAAEVDADTRGFSVEELRRWKAAAESYAEAQFGRGVPSSGGAAVAGLIAIGPDVIAKGRVLRTVGRTWSIAVDQFLVGDLTSLRRFADSFSEVEQGDCYVCVQADGVGRMLVDAPETDLTNGLLITLHVAAPLPVANARQVFDVNRRGSDVALDLSGDEPDVPLRWNLISGADTIVQQLVMQLGSRGGGRRGGSVTGSRVAELCERLGQEVAPAIIAIETIRLATVAYEDTLFKTWHVPLNFIERVRGVRLLPTTSRTHVKAAITLDVYGVAPGVEYVAPILTSVRHLGPRLPPQSVTDVGPTGGRE